MSDFDDVHRMSLSSFLENELGLEGKRVGDTIRFSACPCCGEGNKDSVRLAVFKDDMSWKCFRRGNKPGDIVDAAKLLWGTNTHDTLNRLLGRTPEATKPKPVRPRLERSKSEDDTEKKVKAENLRKAILKLQDACESHRDDAACLDYLLIERSLPLELVREAQRRKMLCFMPSDPKECKLFLEEALGETLMKASGLWKDGAKAPSIMYRPLLFIMPGCHSAAFRIIGNGDEDQVKENRYGTATLPWVWRVQSSDRGMVVEGFIDMLSAVALGFNGHVVGLPGCNNWKAEWFTKIAASLGITRWIEALDNDDEEIDDEDALENGGKLKNPGQYWARKLRELFQELKMDYLHKPLPVRMDVNDVLRNRKKAA